MQTAELLHIPQHSERRPSLALALGGGALRGAAHIGVLEVLTEHGICPDWLVGTSVGSMVAAFYGSGLPTAAIGAVGLKLSQDILFDIQMGPLSLAWVSSKILFEALGVGVRWLKPTPNGLAQGRAFEDWLRKTLPCRYFEELRPRVVAVAADLRTGETVLLSDAETLQCKLPRHVIALSTLDIATAVRASCSIPWLYTPRRAAGRMLVDGAVTHPVPAQVARWLGADVVIAVDVGANTEPPEEVRGIAKVLSQTMDISSRELARMQLQYADIVIEPRVENLTLTDFARMPGCIEAGRAATREALPRLLECLQRCGGTRA